MWKRELIRNKIYAVLMVLASLPVVILERDGTVLLLSLFFGVPMFFAKENWIMYDNFSRGIEALIRRYEMEQGDDVWLCTYKLKEIGCDLEKWEKERGDQ